MKELKKDNTRMILTTDKGVSMVVMDLDEYIQKSEDLLSQSTYKTIPTDATTKYKNKSISLLKPSKQKVGSMKLSTKGYILHRQDPPNFMGYPKYTKKGCH